LSPRVLSFEHGDLVMQGENLQAESVAGAE
jgi:hypothetical protein